MKDNYPSRFFSIGSPEAWNPDERTHLKDNFYPLRQFLSISEDRNMFLVGRRGSGKSAIALMLEAEGKQIYKEAIQGEEAQYGEYLGIARQLGTIAMGNDAIDVKGSIKRLWQWAIPVKAMQTLLSKSELDESNYNINYTKLNDYFKSLGGNLTKESSIGHLLTDRFAKGIDILNINGQHDFNNYLVGLTQNQQYKRAVEALNQETFNNPMLLAFDTLESYKIFSPFMIEGLKGIVEALVSIRNDKRMDGVSIKFFLPSEVYDQVISEFPGKVQLRAVFLRWKVRELGSMLAKRYLRIIERTKSIPRDKILKLKATVEEAYENPNWQSLRSKFWYETKFFPSQIKNTLGMDEDCFAYIIRHSQRRPRDIIAIMQRVIHEARKRNEFPFLSNDSIVRGIHNPKTLQVILQDALTPYEGIFPGNLIRTAQSLFFKRPTIMRGRELVRFAKELYDILPASEINELDFVKVLINCGVIGIVEDEKPKYKNELYCISRFEYLMEDTIPWSERFLYSVHPIMADAFNMKPEEGRGAIYPYPDFVEEREIEEEF